MEGERSGSGVFNCFCFTQSSRETDIFYTNSDSGFDERIDNIQEYHLWLDFADINPSLFMTTH